MNFKKEFSRCALLTLLGGFSSITYADDTMEDSSSLLADKSINYIVGMALTEGGDKLAKVYLEYEDGDVGSENIKAGGSLYFYGGMQFNTPAFPLRLTLGYFIDSVNADNGSVSFSRMPLELLGLYSNGPHAIGLGPTYHLSPELDLADAGLGTLEVDDALGLVLMYEYTFDDIYAVGVRYTNISYDFDGEDLDGSNLGLVAEMKF